MKLNYFFTYWLITLVIFYLLIDKTSSTLISLVYSESNNLTLDYYFERRFYNGTGIHISYMPSFIFKIMYFCYWSFYAFLVPFYIVYCFLLNPKNLYPVNQWIDYYRKPVKTNLLESIVISSVMPTGFLNPELAIKISEKLFWNDLFIKNQISTPQVYAIIKDNQIIEGEIPNQVSLIIKPNTSCLSIGLQKYLYQENRYLNVMTNQKYYQPKDFIKTLPQGTFLVQELVDSCNNHSFGNTHLRIVTIFNPKNKMKVEVINSYCDANHSKLASNDKITGHIMQFDCPNPSNSQSKHKFQLLCSLDTNPQQTFLLETNYSLQPLINQIINLHQNQLQDAYLLSWDIVLGCQKAYLLEGNLLTSWISNDYLRNQEKINQYYDNMIPYIKQRYQIKNIKKQNN